MKRIEIALKKLSLVYFLSLVIILLIFFTFLFYSFLYIDRPHVYGSDKYTFLTNNLIIGLVILISTSIFFYLKNQTIKLNYFLSHFSIIFSLFLINVILEIRIIINLEDNRIVQFEKKGSKWDKRSRQNFISDLKIQSNKENIYSGVSIRHFITEDISQRLNLGNSITPLSHIPNSTIVFCNETGIWRHYLSDKNGFNNASKIIKNKSHTNILLLGDSFTEGECVDRNDNISSQLINLNYNVLNLGKAAGGLLTAYSIFREYKNAYNFKPEFVFFLFYSSNDIFDTLKELKHDFYKKYYNNENYSQNLKNRQIEKKDFWLNYYNIINKKNFKNSKFYKEYVKDKINANQDKINYTYHLKNIILFTNIRSNFHKITFGKSAIKNKEYYKNIDTLKNIFIKFEREVGSINNNTNFVVVYLPSYKEIVDNNPQLKNDIKLMMNEIGIDFVDPYSEFINMKLEDIFHQGIKGHYNKSGYGALANIINEYINEKKLN